MGRRSEALAREFEQANQAVIDALQGLPASGWDSICAGERWTAGVVFHHLAASYPPTVAVARAVAEGNAPPVSWEALHQANAGHARDHAGCTREETLDLLQANAETAAAAIREFSDDELDGSDVMPVFGEQPVSAEQVLRFGLIDHIDQHVTSVRSATTG